MNRDYYLVSKRGKEINYSPGTQAECEREEKGEVKNGFICKVVLKQDVVKYVKNVENIDSLSRK